MAAHNIRVRGIRHKEVDEDKLALAFLLLAKTLHEQTHVEPTATAARPDHHEPEAA